LRLGAGVVFQWAFVKENKNALDSYIFILGFFAIFDMLVGSSLMRTIRELISYMSGKSFGTLANLAKILEEATDPESQLRENKRESKPTTTNKPSAKTERKKPIDPKRKAWHDRRLREQTVGPAKTGGASLSPESQAASQIVPQATRAAAAGASGGLLDVLASAKDAKPKDGPKRPEAWKRKPSDPFF